MSKPIKETLEVIVSLAAIGARTAANLANDGKISYIEAAGYLSELGTVRTALQGITEVPAELKDLDADEVSELRTAVLKALAGVGITHRTQDITDRLLEWAYSTVHTMLFIRNAPPVPEVVA